MADKISIVILISGRGSNMQAIIDACENGACAGEVVAVISNVDGAKGLDRASDHGIPAFAVPAAAYDDRAAFERALMDRINDFNPDLICLAGFMKILGAEFIARWPRRILNIHPSLLPDYKGLNVHKRVLADGRAESGCSVHYVVPDVDAGEVIVQKRVPVLNDDTEDTLSARILEQEHKAYPEAIGIVAQSLLNKA